MGNYVVYLTTYKGELLPTFYIGSSNKFRISKGYRGTVSSKEYKSIWLSELKINDHLFSTRILKEFDTDKEARTYEAYLQTSLNVVKNDLYINKSVACINGYFGMDVSGKNNPRYGSIYPNNVREAARKANIGMVCVSNDNGNTWIKVKTEEYESKKSN